MNFVILGGSFTGLSVAVTIAKIPSRQKTRIILVEPKAYLEVRWATIRSMFEEAVSRGCTVPLTKILKPYQNITHIRSRATSVGIDNVLLESGEMILFDTLLVATGSETSFLPLTPHLTPGTQLEEKEAIFSRRRFLRDTGEGILSSKSVLVIGGGPVGTELAADIAAYAQRRSRTIRVTLVDTKERLIPAYSMSAGVRLEEKLSALGVDVVLNHRAIQDHDGSWKVEETGMKLEADIVIRTTGVSPGAPHLFGDDSYCVKDGWIRTDVHGRVVGMRGNIFAGGDCCDWKAKSGENTLSNRNVYAHNIRLTLDTIASNRALASIDSKLKKISVERNLAVVTSGPKDGVVALPLGSMSLFLPWIKNREMFLAKAKREIGW